METAKIHFFSDPADYFEKERLYLEVRRREGRLLPDETVRALPSISKSNIYAQEWRWRRRSFQRLKNYFEKKFSGKNARILDLGCGNGWMSNRLAERPEWDVLAADLNVAELEQGARLFGRGNLRFAYANVLQNVLPDSHFDAVVLAAAVQYFPDLKALLLSLQKALKPGGEIHILDSPFYKNETRQAAARHRTLEYYSKIGVPEMADFYFHHLWADVGGMNLNARPDVRFLQKIKWLAPFPWVVARTF